MDDGVKLAATVTCPSLDGQTPRAGAVPGRARHDAVQPQRRVRLLPPDSSPRAGWSAASPTCAAPAAASGTLEGNYFSPREARDGATLIEHFGTQP